MRIIYLISPGKDALTLDRVLQSVLTCYGQDWQSNSIYSLEEWEVDELLTDCECHVILTECDSNYFQRFAQSLMIPCQWWQILYPSSSQWQQVFKQILKIKEKLPLASVTFALSSEYSTKVWNTFLDLVNPKLLRDIRSQGEFQSLPSIKLEKLYFSSTDDIRRSKSSIAHANMPIRKRTTMLSPRADRHTNFIARQLICMAIEMVKIESLNLESSNFQSYHL